jgi:hypothetical protein
LAVSNPNSAFETIMASDTGSENIKGHAEPTVMVAIRETPPLCSRIKMEPVDLESVGYLVSCSVCGKRVRKTSLRVHMKRTHLDEGIVLRCPLCSKVMRSKGVYYKHMHIHRKKGQLLLPTNAIFSLRNASSSPGPSSSQ